jgi:hypothetical protein
MLRAFRLQISNRIFNVMDQLHMANALGMGLGQSGSTSKIGALTLSDWALTG